MPLPHSLFDLLSFFLLLERQEMFSVRVSEVEIVNHSYMVEDIIPAEAC